MAVVEVGEEEIVVVVVVVVGYSDTLSCNITSHYMASRASPGAGHTPIPTLASSFA